MNSNQCRYPVCWISLELFQNKVLTLHIIMDIKPSLPTFLLYISCFAFTPDSYQATLLANIATAAGKRLKNSKSCDGLEDLVYWEKAGQTH